MAVPEDNRLRIPARRLELALKASQRAAVGEACLEFLNTASDFYGVSRIELKVLAARPVRVREGWSSELFGDYHPVTKVMRVWMRTAVQRKVTSYGTFLSTLCHEFCHHLDFELFKFEESPHTRGFYERTAILYHHAKGTPRKRLFWADAGKGAMRIDWLRTNRGS